MPRLVRSLAAQRGAARDRGRRAARDGREGRARRCGRCSTRPRPPVRATAIELLGFTGDASDADALARRCASRRDRRQPVARVRGDAGGGGAALGRIGTRRAADRAARRARRPGAVRARPRRTRSGGSATATRSTRSLRQAPRTPTTRAQAAAQALGRDRPAATRSQLGSASRAPSAHLDEAAALAEAVSRRDPRRPSRSSASIVDRLLRRPEPALHRLHRARLAVDHALPARRSSTRRSTRRSPRRSRRRSRSCCPAYNEEAGIVESVHALLAAALPAVRVIVVNDGSKDGTLAAAAARRSTSSRRRGRCAGRIPHAPIRGTYRAPRHRELLVVDKENGGKADALNAGVNAARYPYVCAVDADAILEPDALLRVAKPLLDDPDLVVATGGIVRIANGCTVEDGRVTEVRLPHEPAGDAAGRRVLPRVPGRARRVEPAARAADHLRRVRPLPALDRRGRRRLGPHHGRRGHGARGAHAPPPARAGQGLPRRSSCPIRCAGPRRRRR